MLKEDWEAATRHMQRASAIDPEVVVSEFADSVVVRSGGPLVALGRLGSDAVLSLF